MRWTEGSRGAALGLILCLVGVWLALSSVRPPAPIPASTAAGEFSAERAMRHVEAIAAEIHSPGSAAHVEVVDYLLSELRGLGLQPELQEGWSSRVGRSAVDAAQVRNVVARVEGSGDGKAVLLLTHYDSVPTGPGAGDDAAGVAAVLETLRALGDGARLENDLIVLVTDAEESGLLGAKFFVDEHPWAEDVGLVLNLEARGNRGVVTMFETSAGNAWMIRGLSAAPYSYASSMSNEIYQRMPNDTDLSVFLDAGFAGMNFALIGNHAAYHTELDTPENLSRESLQHHGSYALSLSRYFGDLDLGGREGGADAVYFNAVGSWLISYSPVVGLGAAFLCAVLLGLTLYWGRGGSLRGAGVRGGLYAWLLVVLVCPLALMAIWNAFTRLFPAALASPYGEPYQSDLVRLAALLVCVGLTAFIAVLFESSTAEEKGVGTLMPWVLLALASAYFVAGGGFLFVWPAFFLAAALALVSRRNAAREAPTLLLSVGAFVGALIWAPVVMLATEALQVNAVLVMGVLLALPLTLLLPTLSRLVEGRLWPAAVFTVAGLALFGWVGSSATASESTPAPTSLFYAVDLVGERALWASYEEETDEWTSAVIPASTRLANRPEWLPGRPEHQLLFADAPAIEIDGPDAELVDDVFENDIRTLTVRIRAQGAPLVFVTPDASMATIQAIGVEGHVHEIEDPEGHVQLVLQSLPEEGVMVSFRTLDRQPMALDLVGVRPGLPAIEGVEIGPRPAHLLRRSRWLTDSTLVRRSVWF